VLLDAYYAIYLGCCALLIGVLGFVLHRSGAIFLNNAFAGNHTLARAVGRLLDMGFYSLSLGYVGLSCVVTNWEVRDCADLMKVVVGKAGGLFLVLGIGHVFNLLVLAVFWRRSARIGAGAQ
jgi:hypothetical protein